MAYRKSRLTPSRHGNQLMSEDEINGLVERAKSGDGSAFAALYEVYGSRVYSFFRFRVSNTEAAEDLTQLVFLKMIEQLPRYECRGVPFAAWVFRIARNAWIDQNRTTHESVALESLAESPSEGDGPEAAAAAAIDSDQLKRAIVNLPRHQREVIEYRFFGGLSPAETAAQMGRSVGSVRVLQHRALAALRKLLPATERGSGTPSGVAAK